MQTVHSVNAQTIIWAVRFGLGMSSQASPAHREAISLAAAHWRDFRPADRQQLIEALSRTKPAQKGKGHSRETIEAASSLAAQIEESLTAG